MSDIQKSIDALPDFLAPLREAASRYVACPSTIAESGELQIGHRPWVAELNYMLTLYPGIDQGSLDRYCGSFAVRVPSMYAEFLRHVNGAFCFGMSLCGVPRSRLNSPPVLNRSILQCHDLAMASKQWIHEYRVPDGYFHFGGRHFTFSENLAYFVADENRIVSVRGKKKVVAEWNNFTDFLSDELQASEKSEEESRPSQGPK